MSEPEEGSFLRFMQFPLEIRDMIWSEACANRKPEVCTHLYTRRPTKGLPGFPPPQLIVDIDLALMHTCRESRAFLTSKAGGVRFRYSLTAKRNVPCRAFDPALDTLYLGGHNFEDASKQFPYAYTTLLVCVTTPLPGLCSREIGCPGDETSETLRADSIPIRHLSCDSLLFATM